MTDSPPFALPVDPRPVFRVAAFGLAERFCRRMEIVLRHARHNPYRFLPASARGPGDYEIALVDMTSVGGPELLQTLRRLPAAGALLKVGRRADPRRETDDLQMATFTMELLARLNAAVEQQLSERRLLRRNGLATGALPPPAAPEPPLHRPRVLIVDDSAAARRQLALTLQQFGLDCEGVAGAQEALDVLGLRAYAMAFVDVAMPGADGFALTRRIKRQAPSRALPVVILSSRSSPLDLLRGALAGCDGYLVKPVTVQALRATVARMLQRSGIDLGALAPTPRAERGFAAPGPSLLGP